MKWFRRDRKGSSGRSSPRSEEFLNPDTGLNNFTPRAQQVLALARKEADRFNHHFVGTEHVLLGLIALGQGTAVSVLGRMGIDLEKVRSEVEKSVGPGPYEKPSRLVPYTPRVKKVLALAAKEAKALSHTYIGTEHILLGLLREGDGVAARVLKNLRLDTEQTRHEILIELDPNFRATAANPNAESAKPPPELIDLMKRYDVYCAELNQVVIYRNVLFKGIRKLQRIAVFEFIELEQANGQSIFVARNSILKFCEHGSTPGSEGVSEQKP